MPRNSLGLSPGDEFDVIRQARLHPRDAVGRAYHAGKSTLTNGSRKSRPDRTSAHLPPRLPAPSQMAPLEEETEASVATGDTVSGPLEMALAGPQVDIEGELTSAEPGSRLLAETRRGGLELERNQIRAVHDDDLRAYLRSLGVLGDDGMRTACKYCREIVPVDRVAAVFPLGGSIKVACDKPECQAQLLEAIRQREVNL